MRRWDPAGLGMLLAACAPQAAPSQPPSAPAAPAVASPPAATAAAAARSGRAQGVESGVRPDAKPELPEGTWGERVASEDGDVHVTGSVHRMRLDKPISEAVMYGAARFVVENTGARPHRLRAREVVLEHPDGCKPPARNPKRELRVQDVYRIEAGDEILVSREVTLAAGERAVLDIVFPPARAHPKSCARTQFRVHFVLDRVREIVGVAEWIVEAP